MTDIEYLVHKCVSNVIALLVGVVLCLTFLVYQLIQRTEQEVPTSNSTLSQDNNILEAWPM
jgi:hypothetical protein